MENLNKLNYEEIEQLYIKADITGEYKFQNAAEVKKVFGWNFLTIRGMKDLSEEQQQLAEKLICNYLNGFGLGSRHNKRPISIKAELSNRRFKVNFKKQIGETWSQYSYLYFNGSIG